MSVSNEGLQYLLSLGLTEEEALAALNAPPIEPGSIASSISSNLKIQPQIPTIEQTISDQITATGNTVEAQEAQTRLNDYGMNSADARVKSDANTIPLTEEQATQVTQNILNSNPEIQEYYGSNPNATLDSVLPDVNVPPPGSIDVNAMPSQDDIFGTDYGDGATMSTSPTTGGLGDFSDSVTTPIEEVYGEQVTYDTSGNMIPPGQGPQSGIPGIPDASLPGIAELEGVQYRPRKKIGFRERTDIPPVGNDIGAPPQNTVPTSPDIGVPPPTTPPPQPMIVGATNSNSGYGLSRDPSSPAPVGVGLQQQAPQINEYPVSLGNTQSSLVAYRSKGGLILNDPMPGYKGRGV